MGSTTFAWRKDDAVMPKEPFVLGRNWGNRGALILTSIHGPSVAAAVGVRVDASDVSIDIIDAEGDRLDVAIEVQSDAAIGSRDVTLVFRQREIVLRAAFQVLEHVASYAGHGAYRGIGSHLL